MVFEIGQKVWVVLNRPTEGIIINKGKFPEDRYEVRYTNGDSSWPIWEIVYGTELEAWEHERFNAKGRLRGIEEQIERIKGGDKR
jgi:hypothetical protein